MDFTTKNAFVWCLEFYWARPGTSTTTWRSRRLRHATAGSSYSCLSLHKALNPERDKVVLFYRVCSHASYFTIPWIVEYTCMSRRVLRVAPSNRRSELSFVFRRIRAAQNTSRVPMLKASLRALAPLPSQAGGKHGSPRTADILSRKIVHVARSDLLNRLPGYYTYMYSRFGPLHE